MGVVTDLASQQFSRTRARILHIWGGNTFHYLKRIRELNLIPRIREFIDGDGVYVGTSAGSELMCPDLDANLTSDVNDIGLADDVPWIC